MPGGDRTGPAGMGPMTGRAVGFCAGYSVPGYANPVGGRGYFGRGRGGGWGWRNSYYATGLPGWARAGYDAPLAPIAAPEQELAGLKQQVEYFQNAIDNVNKRIEQLEAENKK